MSDLTDYSLHCFYNDTCMRVCSVAQACPTLWDPMDYSLPGSSVHGILQVRILEWVAISLSRGSSQPRDQTCVSCTAGGFFTCRAIREALEFPLQRDKALYVTRHLKCQPFQEFLLNHLKYRCLLATPFLRANFWRERQRIWGSCGKFQEF